MSEIIKMGVTSLVDGRIALELGSKSFILSEIEAEYLCDKLESILYDEPTYSKLAMKVISLTTELDSYKEGMVCR